MERPIEDPASVRALRGKTIQLSNDEEVEADLLLWGTGYAVDIGYLGIDPLTRAHGLNAMARRCYAGFRSIDAANLFLMAPGVLETNRSTTWAYAHVAKSIMSHIGGRPVFVDPPRDRPNYPRVLWYLKYLWLAMRRPSRPMPIP